MLLKKGRKHSSVPIDYSASTIIKKKVSGFYFISFRKKIKRIISIALTKTSFISMHIFKG